MINYKIESQSGSGGSPLFKEEYGKYYVVGTHGGGDISKRRNTGVHLTTEVRCIINSWFGVTGDLYLGTHSFMKAQLISRTMTWKT